MVTSICWNAVLNDNLLRLVMAHDYCRVSKIRLKYINCEQYINKPKHANILFFLSPSFLAQFYRIGIKLNS